MKKIILHRPKSIEKYYDETKYRIFINDQFVAKQKRGEDIELEVEGASVDVQAKYAYWGSRKETIELTDEVTEIDVARNQKTPYTNSPSLYIPSAVLLFSFIPNLLGWRNVWVQALIAVTLIAFIWYIVQYHVINRYEWILIRKRE